MIVSNRRHFFGLSHFGVVKVATFGCAVSTAPEGLFKGCSTIFRAFEGDEWNAEKSNRQLVAKAMLNPSFSKEQRAGVHRNFLEHLDTRGHNGFGLARAIDEVLATARNMGAVVDSINKAQLRDVFGLKSNWPEIYASTQYIALADNATAARIARLPNVVAADARIGEARAALDIMIADVSAVTAAGNSLSDLQSKAYARAAESHSGAINGLCAALNNAYGIKTP